jgi:hypothetical protein
MSTTEATLFVPIWLAVALLTPAVLWAAWPEFVRPRIVHWRKRRRNARRIGI